eukprot:2819660-Amphidinium_carterae.1
MHSPHIEQRSANQAQFHNCCTAIPCSPVHTCVQGGEVALELWHEFASAECDGQSGQYAMQRTPNETIGD